MPPPPKIHKVNTQAYAIVSLLPPANEICEGYVFTRVYHSVHGGGGCPIACCAGIHPPPKSTPPLDQRQISHRHPPGAVHAERYGQQAGGTHPTGMQSCYFYISITLTQTWLGSEVDVSEVVCTVDGVGSGTACL